MEISNRKRKEETKLETIHPRGPSAPSFIAYAALNPLTATNSATSSEFPSNLVFIPVSVELVISRRLSVDKT